MKKAITICLLAVSLLVGGMTMDAKITKKKSRATNSVKTESFTELERQFILPSELVTKGNVRQNTDILKILKNKGFKISYDNFGKWDSAYKEVIDPKTGKKYSMELNWDCGAHACWLYIEFANKQDARNFYKKTKKFNSYYISWNTEENFVECRFF